MACQNAGPTIIQGPSKFDLMLSLFDTEMCARTVRFRLTRETVGGDQPPFWCYIQIGLVRRCDIAATTWEIEGITETQGGTRRVSIYYQSDTRKGSMRFEDELRTHGAMEASDDTKRAEALMMIIFKMVGRYQVHHRGNLDDEIFRSFEKAKRVRDAKDNKSLDEVIKDI